MFDSGPTVRGVGIFQSFASWLNGTPSTGAGAVNEPSGIRSPWAGGSLTRVALAEILGTDALPVNRAEAMSVPAIARARHLLTVDASRCPLEALDAAGVLATQPRWLTGTNLTTTPQHRAVWTVDDLIHYGWSLWVCERDDAGAITDAARCPVEWWRFDADNRVVIKDKPAEAEAIILIPGFHEGIINSAPHTIRGSRRLEVQWQNRASNPIPAVELHQNTPDDMDDEEIKALIRDWTGALEAEGGAVAYTPRSIDVRVHGTAETDLLIQGRNAAAVDAARVVGVPANMIDASNVNASLTYETLESRGSEYVDHSVPLYLGPLEARLSLDDVTPEGTRIRANTSALTTVTPAPTGTPTGD